MLTLPPRSGHRRLVLAAAVITISGGLAAAREPPVPEASFLTENNTAMNTMMAGMAARPSGDIDHDFVAMMAPHHQGAIDMARIYLRYGTNEQLKRLAQEIIVTQQQEIAAMRLAVGEPLPPSAPAPTQATPDTHGPMHQMNMR